MRYSLNLIVSQFTFKRRQDILIFTGMTVRFEVERFAAFIRMRGGGEKIRAKANCLFPSQLEAMADVPGQVAGIIGMHKRAQEIDPDQTIPIDNFPRQFIGEIPGMIEYKAIIRMAGY